MCICLYMGCKKRKYKWAHTLRHSEPIMSATEHPLGYLRGVLAQVGTKLVITWGLSVSLHCYPPVNFGAWFWYVHLCAHLPTNSQHWFLETAGKFGMRKPSARLSATDRGTETRCDELWSAVPWRRRRCEGGNIGRLNERAGCMKRDAKQDIGLRTASGRQAFGSTFNSWLIPWAKKTGKIFSVALIPD